MCSAHCAHCAQARILDHLIVSIRSIPHCPVILEGDIDTPRQELISVKLSPVRIWVEILLNQDLCPIIGSYSSILKPIRLKDIVEQGSLVVA